MVTADKVVISPLVCKNSTSCSLLVMESLIIPKMTAGMRSAGSLSSSVAWFHYGSRIRVREKG